MRNEPNFRLARQPANLRLARPSTKDWAERTQFQGNPGSPPPAAPGRGELYTRNEPNLWLARPSTKDWAKRTQFQGNPGSPPPAALNRDELYTRNEPNFSCGAGPLACARPPGRADGGTRRPARGPKGSPASAPLSACIFVRARFLGEGWKLSLAFIVPGRSLRLRS